MTLREYKLNKRIRFADDNGFYDALYQYDADEALWVLIDCPDAMAWLKNSSLADINAQMAHRSFSIIEHKLEYEHPGIFCGLRVVVSVNKQYRQKYYAFRRKGHFLGQADIQRSRFLAQQLHERWKLDQKRFLEETKNQARELRPTSPYITQVRGIKLKYAIKKKTLKNGRKKIYFTPVIRVDGANAKTHFVKTFYMHKQGFNAAWEQAVRYYAGQKGILRFDHLLKKRPAPEQFMIIIRHMETNGYHVPITCLPKEVRHDHWLTKQRKQKTTGVSC